MDSRQPASIYYDWDGPPNFEALLAWVQHRYSDLPHLDPDQCLLFQKPSWFWRLPLFFREGYDRLRYHGRLRTATAKYGCLWAVQLPEPMLSKVFQLSYTSSDGPFQLNVVRTDQRITWILNSKFEEHNIMRHFLTYLSRSGVDLLVSTNHARLPDTKHFDVMESNLAV